MMFLVFEKKFESYKINVLTSLLNFETNTINQDRSIIIVL